MDGLNENINTTQQAFHEEQIASVYGGGAGAQRPVIIGDQNMGSAPKDQKRTSVGTRGGNKGKGKSCEVSLGWESSPVQSKSHEPQRAMDDNGK